MAWESVFSKALGDFVKPNDLVLITQLFSFQQVKSGSIFGNFLFTDAEELKIRPGQ